jgi:hypothetical protein
MDSRKDIDKIAGSPNLLEPREEAVVEGREVTLKWEASEGATSYRVQVATDAHFDEVILDEEVGDVTEKVLTDVFAPDRRTYFWRVLSGNEYGWSRGNVVESFISASESEAADAPVSPDQEEELGPPGELFKSAGQTVAAEVTGDHDAYEEEGAEAGVEFDYVEAGQIMVITVVILVAIVMAAVVLIQWTDIRHQTVLTEFTGMSGYPELRASETHGTRLLENYEVVDAREGIYRIPIDRAIAIMANEAYEQRDRPMTDELQLLPRPRTQTP